MLNVVFCGYRHWAKETFRALESHPNVNVKFVIGSREEFLQLVNNISSKEIDVIVLLGWSWFVETKILNNFQCVGIHPSDLPSYRGGSPLQNQIVRGVRTTKTSLMSLSSEKMDAGDIWFKEDLDLAGDNMEEIFENLIVSSKKLLTKFFDQYPNIKPTKQVLEHGAYFKRRQPSESRLAASDFANKSPEELYNFIRCLTDPYPNAYLEDDEGNRIYFTGVKYSKNTNN